MTTIEFKLIDKPSNSKGWGRFSASVNGAAIIQSRTGNEWVSANHSGESEDGAEIVLTCQIMNRIGKRKTEEITKQEYRLIVESGATADVDCRPTGVAQGMRIEVNGARLI